MVLANEIKRIMKQLLLIVSGALWFGNCRVSAAEKVDFVKDIQPILQQTCVKCHGPEKQKGKLRLDSKEATFKGGKDGLVITPGDADKSELYRRITLPKGNDDIMPNEGEPLAKAQIELLRDWINQGAEWPEGLVIKAPETKAAEAPAPAAPKLAEYKPGPNELKAIAKLESLGVDVRPIAMNVNWREANLRSLGTNATDATLVPMKDVLGFMELNLANTKITDTGLANLAGLTNLEVLHLEQTRISDAGLAHLKGLGNLTYLNLYGTPVTDAGLNHLKGLTNLKHLYLWQSKVSSNGVTSLKTVLPKLDINTGWDVSALVKKEEKKEDEKKEEKK